MASWTSIRSGVDASAVTILRHFISGSGGTLIEDDSFIAAASRVDYTGPVHNAAIKKDPDANPSQVLEAAISFFSARSRRFVLWVSGHQEDSALGQMAYTAGFRPRSPGKGAAGMYVGGAFAEKAVPDGVRITKVQDNQEAAVFADVVARSFEARATPQPLWASRSLFSNSSVLICPKAGAYLADIDGIVVGAAMVIIEDEIGSICWVSTLPDARGRGIARALTVVCSNYAFERNVRMVALQSSSMGEHIYTRLGFSEVTRYQRFLSPGLSID
jgi:ribosomal protein S18 acetylase RimI-like enzyme